MTDDIRALTARLAEEPGSLAFLELAEALRRRGQLEAAYKVARGGLARYPGLADAHDLHGAGAERPGRPGRRVRCLVLGAAARPDADQRAQGHRVPLFRAGDTAAALEHLQRALDVDPDDRSIRQALARIGGELRARPRPTRPAASAPAPGAAAGSRRPTTADASAYSTASRAASEACCWSTATGSGWVASSISPTAGGRRSRGGAARRGLAGGGPRDPPARSGQLARHRGRVAGRPPGAGGSRPPDTVLLARRGSPRCRWAGVALLAERAARAARAWLERAG